MILILKLIRWLLRPVVRLYEWAEDKQLRLQYYEICGECGGKLDDWGDCTNCN